MRSTDTLANERTYLAYLRTALAFIAFGFVVARFALFEREISIVAHITLPGKQSSTLLGMAMAIAGICVGVFGAIRYHLTDRALRRSEVSVMPTWAAITGGVVVTAIGLIVAINLARFR